MKNACGARCLENILKKRGIEVNIEEIFEKVSGETFFGEKYCQNILMLRYLLERGFQASMVSVRHLKKVLKVCAKNKFHVIFNIRPSVDSSGGHYVVFLKMKGSKIYIWDPDGKKNPQKIDLKILKKLLTPNFCHVCKKNTLLVFNTRKKEFDILNLKYNMFDEDDGEYKINNIKIFKCLKDYMVEILEAKSDSWLKLDKICNE